MKSRVTNYTEISAFSGQKKECDHHLIFGNGLHKLADEDGLTIPLTNKEHNLSETGTIDQIHDNPAAEHLSKIAGQLAFERNYLIERQLLPFDDSYDEISDEAREAFRQRYGKSFL